MKFALVLLFICLASSSHQVQPRAHYIPLYYADGMPAGYDIIDWSKAAQDRDGFPVKRLLGSLLPAMITITSTSTSVVMSTVTTATVANCVPTSLFSAASMTTACTSSRRRRRGIEENDELTPSEIQPVEASVLTEDLPAMLPEDREIATTEIASSKADEELAPKAHPALLPRGGALSTTRTVTVTSTSVTFVPTTVTSTRLIASTSALLCLPTGYVVC